MSAPDSDPDKQAYQHRGPLRGMFAVILFALVLLAGLALWVFVRGGDPDGTEAQVQSTTGEVEGGTVASPMAGDSPDDGEVAPDPAVVTVSPETEATPEASPEGSQTALPPNPGGEAAPPSTGGSADQ